MKTCAAAFLILGLAHSACAARAVNAFFPDRPGTVWEYEQTGAEPAKFTIHIVDEEPRKGVDVLNLETTAGTDLIQAQFISVGEHKVLLYARRSTAGEVVNFDPPRVLLPIPLKVGTQWELEDDVAGTAMLQKLKVIAEETITVPAGEFHALHLHCEQPWPLSIVIDRWFAPGTGFVKDVTSTRGPDGRLLSRVTTVLTKFALGPPPAEPPPSALITLATPTPTPKPSITLEVAAVRDGKPTTTFSSDAPNIYVNWHGEHLKPYSMARVAWVVEDVGDVAEPNFVVDENETEVTGHEFGARFTLSRPKDGWAEGKYRLELYLDDQLMQKVEVLISDGPPTAETSPKATVSPTPSPSTKKTPAGKKPKA
ncbi:MAG: hypothetical protein ABI992_05070 [Chthoniobacterales bacterium]